MADKQKPIMIGKKFQWKVSLFQRFPKMSGSHINEDTTTRCCHGAGLCCLPICQRPTVQLQPQPSTMENVMEHILLMRKDIGEMRMDIGELMKENGEMRKDIGGLRKENGEMRKDIGELQAQNKNLMKQIENLKERDQRKFSYRLETKQKKLKILLELEKSKIKDFQARPDKAHFLEIEKTEMEISRVTEEVEVLTELLLQFNLQKPDRRNDWEHKDVPSTSLFERTKPDHRATTSLTVTTNNEKNTLEKEEPGDEVEVFSTFYQELNNEAANESYNSQDDPDYQPPFTPSEKSNFVSPETEYSDSFLQSGPIPDDSISVQNAPKEKAEEHGSGRAEGKRPESLLTDEEDLKNPTPCEDDYK